MHTHIHAHIYTHIHTHIHTQHTYIHTERLKENTTKILYYSGVTKQATYVVSIRRPFTNQIVIWRKRKY